MVGTSDFPQADRLAQVGRVVIAVTAGKHSDGEIEAFLGLASGRRQGRYYRLAAEILGLINTTENYSSLTPLGTEYSTLTSELAKMDLLARCLIETPVFREGLRYINQHKPNDTQLRAWFRSFYPGAQSTADRRFSTFLSYLRDADLLGQNGTQNDLLRHRGSVVKEVAQVGDGLTGRSLRQIGITAPVFSNAGIVQSDIDVQKLERANQTHWKLIDAKATFLEDRGVEPYSNPHIDLFTNDDGDVILYEMKSVDDKSVNLLSQVRKAVSQLYEYRYIYQEPSARLCIVTNAPVNGADQWLLEYLAKDRSIAYEWTSDFSNFESDANSRALLGNLAP